MHQRERLMKVRLGRLKGESDAANVVPACNPPEKCGGLEREVCWRSGFAAVPHKRLLDSIFSSRWMPIPTLEREGMSDERVAGNTVLERSATRGSC